MFFRWKQLSPGAVAASTCAQEDRAPVNTVLHWTQLWYAWKLFLMPTVLLGNAPWPCQGNKHRNNLHNPLKHLYLMQLSWTRAKSPLDGFNEGDFDHQDKSAVYSMWSTSSQEENEGARRETLALKHSCNTIFARKQQPLRANHLLFLQSGYDLICVCYFVFTCACFHLASECVQWIMVTALW